MTLETARAFYRRQGWNPGYGHKVKTQGRLVTVLGAAGKELVDVEASIARMDATADPGKAHMGAVNERQRAAARPGGATGAAPPARAATAAPAGGNATYMQAKTAREVYEAKTAQFEYEELIGKFLKKDEVDSAIFEIARALRDGLTNCARRIAADVAALGSAEDCEAVIDREHRALLDSMTHRISSKLGASMANAAA